ncbi:MAG TPA: hypothetical protein VM531_11380 [Sphingomicrobium sp.]|nr:hypothetical protein [Sphingomicrobium sp.]
MPIEVVAMLRQASADAKRVDTEKAFRKWLAAEVDALVSKLHDAQAEERTDKEFDLGAKLSVIEKVLANFDRLLAERGGEEG